MRPLEYYTYKLGFCTFMLLISFNEKLLFVKLLLFILILILNE